MRARPTTFRLACCILLALAASACVRSDADWKPLVVDDGGFSVLMRNQPHYARQVLDTPAGRMEAHLYSSDRPDAYFAVGYSDYPLALVVGGPPQELFAGVRDTWVRRLDGRVTATDDRIRIGDRYPGYAFSGEGKTKNGDAILDARLYLVGQRLYQVVAISRKGEISQGTVNRFLDSFRLIEEKQVGSITIEPSK
jgi:hypothetical protein